MYIISQHRYHHYSKSPLGQPINLAQVVEDSCGWEQGWEKALIILIIILKKFCPPQQKILSGNKIMPGESLLIPKLSVVPVGRKDEPGPGADMVRVMLSLRAAGSWFPSVSRGGRWRWLVRRGCLWPRNNTGSGPDNPASMSRPPFRPLQALSRSRWSWSSRS